MRSFVRSLSPVVARLAAAAVLLAVLASDALAQSCAMCGGSFGENDPVQRAFSWSILFLIATPYSIAAAIGGYLFFTHRRGQRRHRAAVVRFPRAARSEGEIA